MLKNYVTTLGLIIQKSLLLKLISHHCIVCAHLQRKSLNSQISHGDWNNCFFVKWVLFHCWSLVTPRVLIIEAPLLLFTISVNLVHEAKTRKWHCTSIHIIHGDWTNCSFFQSTFILLMLLINIMNVTCLYSHY